MSVNKFSQYPKSAQIAIIVGVGCVLFGVWRLFGVAFGYGWWNAIQLLSVARRAHLRGTLRGLGRNDRKTQGRFHR